MIINADSLLPHLRRKVRPTQSDASRHLICPHCDRRTKLNTLGDGRRKCTVCGKKFRIHKVSEDIKLRQCVEILLCFCLDFSALRTAQITQHRHRLVAFYYDHFRTLLTEHSVPLDTLKLLPDLMVNTAEPKSRWISERSRSRPGIWKKNTELYLKELEWKYDHRSQDPGEQAKTIIDLIPADFLTVWTEK